MEHGVDGVDHALAQTQILRSLHNNSIRWRYVESEGQKVIRVDGKRRDGVNCGICRRKSDSELEQGSNRFGILDTRNGVDLHKNAADP